RLVHQQLADVVQVVTEVDPPLGHAGTRYAPDAAGDDPGAHALSARVVGVEVPSGPHPRPFASPFSARARTAAFFTAVSGCRGSRHGPPGRPATSMESLMACTNSVLESQRSSGWSCL